MSIQKKEILLHLNEAINGGAKEVVLTGVNLGSWGKDLDGQENLSGLLKFLLNESDISRIRLSSLEPWDIEPSFFNLWQNPRLCNHLHFPLQSGAESELHRMARKTTPQKFRELIDSARSRIPNVSITTDIIVGFPGETEDEFAESLDFIEEMNFSGGHVFRYSRREGTAAAKYSMQIPGKTASERARRVRGLLDIHERNFVYSQLGKNHQVLWESSRETKPGNWELEGYSENYVRVRVNALTNRWNRIDMVGAEKFDQNIVLGKILDDGVGQDE